VAKQRKYMTLDLGNGYFAEVDHITESEWSNALKLFSDASVYQALPYGIVRWGTNSLSHLVVRKNDSIVGLAQITIIKVPLIKAGIAYVPWGPLWRTRQEMDHAINFQNVIHALKWIYADRRGFFVRIAPNCFRERADEVIPLLEREHFIKANETYRTFVLDLSPRLDDIRKALDPKWRNQLNGAEKNNLAIVEGDELSFYDTFIKLYRQMRGRKQFNTAVDIDQFRIIHDRLKGNDKLHILVCKHEGEPIASLVCTTFGDTGTYLLGATGDRGLTLKGSYLLQWHMIKRLKESGYRYYDLGGIDPSANPGVFHFKAGLNGEDLHHIGQYEVCTNKLSIITVKWGEVLRRMQRRIIRALS
jgi:lipid II:glycine glycyltransferase (peptidoglycan interpeptide bridge formation enzyme)